jgi:MraZ protein
MSMLGEYEYKIDAKGRVPIPPKFRIKFSEGIVLARGFDRCIHVYPPPVWDEIAKLFSGTPIAPSKQRSLERFIFGNAFSLEVDEQGRVLLPPKLRDYAGIKEAAVIVGANTRLEIWNKDAWEQEQAEISEQAWLLVERMEKRE